MNCEFCIKDGEEYFQCSNEATSRIARTKKVCKSHYHLLCRDNKVRTNKEIEIPNSFDLFVKLDSFHKYKCTIKTSKPIFNDSIDGDLEDHQNI